MDLADVLAAPSRGGDRTALLGDAIEGANGVHELDGHREGAGMANGGPVGADDGLPRLSLPHLQLGSFSWHFVTVAAFIVRLHTMDPARSQP